MGTAPWSSWRRSRRAPRPRTGAGGAGRLLSGAALQSSGCQRQGCHAPIHSKCTCVCMYVWYLKAGSQHDSERCVASRHASLKKRNATLE